MGTCAGDGKLPAAVVSPLLALPLSEALISLSLQHTHVLGTFHPLEQLILSAPIKNFLSLTTVGTAHLILQPIPPLLGAPWLPSHNLPRVEYSVLGCEVGVERWRG